MQKLRSHLLGTHSSNALALKPGVGQNIALHALPTARVFSSLVFNLPGPFTFIFQTLFRVIPVLAVANAGSRVSPQNTIK